MRNVPATILANLLFINLSLTVNFLSVSKHPINSEKIRERISHEPSLQLLFLESFCNDPEVIATNIALKVQSGDPDYQGMSRSEAEADFRRRIDAYERVYQTITEPGISFCRILNVGQQVTINRIQGYLQSRIAFYLMNLHLKPRSIYLSRVSQCGISRAQG
jgi:6-phosphofructo-2-kinase/fructose-2,6-biphosphatase 2